MATRRVEINFTEPVLGVSSRSMKIAGVRGKLKFKQASRKATILPRRPLKAGRRYRIVLSSAITDLTLNKLRPIALTFKP